MMRAFVAVAAATLAVVGARTLSHEPSERALSLWSEAHSAEGLTVDLALHLYPAAPEDALEREVLRRSTPGSPVFRQWLTRPEVRSLIAAKDSSIERVVAWLAGHGLEAAVHPMGHWVRVEDVPAKVVEDIFATKLSVWSSVHGRSTVRVASGSSYTIPEEVDDVVEHVSGMHVLPGARRGAPQVLQSEATAQDVTVDIILDTYSINVDTSVDRSSQSQASVQFGRTANFDQGDLDTFLSKYAPSLTDSADVTYLEGSSTGFLVSLEANLDTQMEVGVGAHVSTYVYKFDDVGDIEEAFVEYTQAVLAESNPAMVQSISYGEYGGDYDNSTVQSFDQGLQAMNALGISTLLASGDNGVGCNSAGTSEEFDFPSSPHLTMVGATYLDRDGTEVGATLSSGGFSKDYYRPSWQSDAVSSFFTKATVAGTLPSESYYADGRAYPDISAFGYNLQVVKGGKTTTVGGTSCSSPMFAGMVALINYELAQSGKSTMGWLNPFLYSDSSMYNDITSGNNAYQKCDGFTATAGWDPVTGMGTPIFDKMLAAALSY